MTDDQARATVRNLLRVMGRCDAEQRAVDQMTRRELSQGLMFAARLKDVAVDVQGWLQNVADRLLQDQASPET